MTDFEKAIQQAVDAQEIPGCVLLATNRDGIVHMQRGARFFLGNSEPSKDT